MVGKKRKKEQENNSPKKLTPWQIEHLKYQEELASNNDEEVVNHADSNQLEETIIEVEDDFEDTESEKELEKWSVTEAGYKTFKLSTEAELDKEIDDSVKKIKDLPKAISFADKLPKMKERRKKRLKKRLLIVVGLFITLVLGLLYYISPLSKVGTVKVVGNEKIASEHVISAVGLDKGKFIWDAYFDKKAFEKAKKDNPRINSVERKMIGLNGLKLIVTEYPEVAYVKENNQLFPVLESGAIIRENVVKPENKFPLMVNFKEGEVLKAFVEKFYIVSNDVKKNIKEIHAAPTKNNPYLVTIYMEDGNEILASARDYFEKINYYPSIAKQMTENGVVDMEAGVFSKSYATIAAEEATKKANEAAEKVANGEVVAPDNGNVKDQVTKDDSVSGMGYDKWLEKLQEGDIQDIINGKDETLDENQNLEEETTSPDQEPVDPVADQPVNPEAENVIY